MDRGLFTRLLFAASSLWLFCTPVLAAASGDAFVDQSFQEFDQKLDTGWRTLQIKGDYQGAADAILQYQSVHDAQLQTWQKDSLAFHLGHLYAMTGDKPKAIEWLQKSLAGSGNPAYIQAYIAFLRGDKAALVDTRHTLATTNPGPWRAEDLDEVDAMLAYFDEPFEAAWAALNCHDPGIKTDTPVWVSYCQAMDVKYRKLYLQHGIKLQAQ
ncbi:MAG TPA: hypothetical protein VGM47_11605 [Gammaproteobacteria bacterium]|jgi:hypothetical protein